MPQRLLDTTKLNDLGWASKTSLDHGLHMTYEYFRIGEQVMYWYDGEHDHIQRSFEDGSFVRPRSLNLTNGPKVRQFENQWAEWLGVAKAFSVCF